MSEHASGGRDWNQILGPGLLIAAAAIGASHLVQSTRAGADFGFALVGLVIVANLAKYPFFEFGHRYGAATGGLMLEGYRRLGVPVLALFLGISLCTMVRSLSALTFLTAALARNLLGSDWSTLVWAVIVIGLCNGVLLAGRYRVLDSVTKGIIGILGLCTIVAVAVALLDRGWPAPDPEAASAFTMVHLTFLIALMGWMPAPIELSVWPSIWMRQRARETGRSVAHRDAMLDFNVGYGATIVLALAFLSLGAIMMYGTGNEIPAGSVAFAQTLVSLFTASIGAWIGPLIALAAFTCMFSTTLTCLDGYPRSNAVATILLRHPEEPDRHPRLPLLYWAYNGLTVVLTLVIIRFFVTSLTGIVDFVTTVAFLAAPILATLNLLVVRRVDLLPSHRPPRWLLGMAYAGLVFLYGMSGLHIWNVFIR